MANAEAYRAARESAVRVDRTDRVRLRIEGPDRAKFLHNLTTNDVKRLAIGSGQETFVTSPQGKTLAYATLLALDDAILLRTDAGSLGTLLPHLRKYGVFDDVAIEDVSAKNFEIHLAGPGVDATWAALGVGPIPETPLAHGAASLAGVEIRVVRESPTGRPGLTLIGPIEALGAIRDQLAGAIPMEIDADTFEALRIEAGTPVSGVDVLANNLPQEVGRDALAINFVKGCYLGQETVARLDALGHVNKILAGLRVTGEVVPKAGTTLLGDGKAVGSITSSARSGVGKGSIALAYVRVAQAVGGTRLAVGEDGGGGEATVVPLPMREG